MILTALKFLMIMDKKATSKFSLLLRFHSGIHIQIIENLLLPSRGQLRLAQKIEEYFRSRNNNSQFPSLIDEGQISPNSFSVLFAQRNVEMQQLKAKIIEESKGIEATKRKEVQILREKLNQMIKERDEMECKAHLRPKQHFLYCTRCELTRTIEASTVSIYERPLSAEECARDAVVFEMLIPDEIAALRDALYYFNEHICSSFQATQEAVPVPGLWKNVGEISKHFCGKQEFVKLGSTSCLFSQTLGKMNPLLYVDDAFIVDNAYNCKFVFSGKIMLYSKNGAKIKEFCTFLVDQNSPYSSLQLAVESTKHSENQGIAKQIDCPKELTLMEYKEFAKLRSGHRLQIRNIFRALEQRTLSLKSESVFNLLCQSLWEAGPPLENQRQFGECDWLRESNCDFFDSAFAREMLLLLEKIAERHSRNWVEHYTLLSVIIIVQQILVVNIDESIRNKAMEILERCTMIGLDWCEQIEDKLANKAQISDDEAEKLRIKLIDVACCTAITYRIEEADSETLHPLFPKSPGNLFPFK